MSIISSILNGAKSQEAAEEYRKAAQGMPLVGRARDLLIKPSPQNPPQQNPLPQNPLPHTGTISGSTADWLTLTDIVCVGADNKPFEEHKTIYVAKDVVRNSDGSPDTNFTPYKAITYFEAQGNGEFLPSFALSCNILATIFEKAVKKQGSTYTTLDAEFKAVLHQYKDRGNSYGWHAQNTLAQWNERNSKVIHYPYNTQFPNNGGSNAVNQQGLHLHKELSFNSKGFGDVLLEKALKNQEFTNYIKNLTGLKDPTILSKIGEYFQKPAKILVPNNPDAIKDIRAAWLGCSYDNFYINTSNFLGNFSAVRGVRR